MAGKKKNSTPSTSGLKLTSPRADSMQSTTTSQSDDDRESQRITAKCPRLILPVYALNTQIICQYSDSYFYDGKIIKVEKGAKGEFLYTIHYNGWNSRYDEVITHTDAQTKFIQHTPENLALAKREIAEARKRKNSKSITIQKKAEKKPKLEGSVDKPLHSQTPTKFDDASKNPASNRQGSSTSRVEMGVEDSTNSTESEDDLRPRPYLSQIPKEQRTTLIFSRILDKVVNDDCDLVTRQFKLPKLPVRYTINDIVNNYLSASIEVEKDDKYFFKPKDDSKTRELLHALLRFFNQMIGLRILYKFEFVKHIELLNAKRAIMGLPDLPLKDYMDQNDVVFPDSPTSEENTDDPDVAFKPAKQSKPQAPANEGEPEKRQLRETRNKKTTYAPLGLVKVVAKPKKKQIKYGSSGSDNLPDFTDTYGFVHLVRFFYNYNELLKNKIISKAIYAKHVDTINDIMEYLSLHAKEYYKVDQDYQSTTAAYQREAFF